MAPLRSFNSTVSARTSAAVYVLDTPASLALYRQFGGLPDDLAEIRDHGLDAERLSVKRSQAQAAGGAATTDVVEAFEALQNEYGAVMAIVQAVLRDLQRAEAPAGVIKAVEQILVNEAELAVTAEESVDKEGKPQSKRTVRRKVSREALRAEFSRDAGALLDLKAAHAALGRRGVDPKRLNALKKAADGLSGKLTSRVAAKAGAKKATATMSEAVNAQSEVWGSVYRILARVGRADPTVASLLKDAARKR